MPFVEIKILEGLTHDQKAGLAADVTRSLVERCGKNPESIHIVIAEVPKTNWAHKGQLVSERAKPQGVAPADDQR